MRPILEVLDHAQRTNTIGNLSAEDVSQSITAPAVLARTAAEKLSSPQRVVVENSSSDADSSALSASLSAYTETMQQLKDRLNEPFVTVNSVTGELGMKQAQDEYDRLMRNKTPKSRR